MKDGGRARYWAQQISCSAGLGSGLAFGEIFAPLLGISQPTPRLNETMAKVNVGYEKLGLLDVFSELRI